MISARFYDMSMTLNGVSVLSSEATEIWVNVTTDFYEMVHNTGVVVVTDTDETTSTGASSRRQWKLQRQRYLQTQGIEDFSTIITYQTQSRTTNDENNNTLGYFQEVSYIKTSDSAPSAARLIQYPFLDEVLNRFYVDTLRASNPAFSGMKGPVPVPTISTTTTPTTPSTDNKASGSDTNNDKNGLSLAAIAGIVIGIVFLLALLFLACQYRSSSNYNHNSRRLESTSGYRDDQNDNNSGRGGRAPPGGDNEASGSRTPRSDDFHDDAPNNKKRSYDCFNCFFALLHAFQSWNVNTHSHPCCFFASIHPYNSMTKYPRPCVYLYVNSSDTQRRPSANDNMFFAENEEYSEQYDDDDAGGSYYHSQQHDGDEDRDGPADLGPKLRDNEELLVIQAPSGWLGVVIGKYICVCTSPSPACAFSYAGGTADRSHRLLLPPFFLFIFDHVCPDTPNQNEPPVVHDIKESSAIFGILQIGDRLIAIDDEDVTQMTATQVSKVISKKAANPVRLLRVIRTKNDDDDEDSIEIV
jgi:hypothetical protein